MKAPLFYPLFLFIFVGICLSSEGQITSTFDTDAEGWTVLNGTSSTPVYVSTGGNPGGFLQAADGVGGFQTKMVAPAKFLGNRILSYGQFLRFDLKMALASNVSNNDIIISGGGTSIVRNIIPPLPNTVSWTTYSQQLHESQIWRIGSTSGPIATKEQVKQVLTSVTAIHIGVEYNSLVFGPTDMHFIDNIILEQRTLLPTPTITSFSPTSAEPGTAITINGNNFDPTGSNNVVYFGPVAATITSASTTQLTVSVPTGATYDAITVINKTTGLAGQSLQKFNPTFADGGRIIRSSFKNRIDISMNEQIDQVTLADVDGDGWSDIVVAESSNQAIDVYRNLGVGGLLSPSSFAPRVRFLTGVGFTNGAGIRMANLDNDGKLDAITSGGRTPFVGAFIVFRNISTPGTIAFETPKSWDGISDESPIVFVGDIDGDGLAELVGGEIGSFGGDFWILQNISTPGNIDFGTSVNYPANTLRGVSFVDLNGDGKPELIEDNGSALDVWTNNSTPGTISLTLTLTLPFSGDFNVEYYDFNADGKNDIVYGNFFSGNDIKIRLNTNAGGALAVTDFSTELIIQSDLGYANRGITLADINGDGKPEIVATDPTHFGVFENVTSGTFNTSSFLTAYLQEGFGSYNYPGKPAIGDLNGDGKPDVVIGTTNTAPYLISIFENNNIHTPEISITTVSPLKGAVGSTVTITGDHFSTVPSENTVLFGAVKATVLTATKNLLTVSVPAGAAYAPVSVTKGNLTARYHLPFTTTFSAGVIFNNTMFAPPVSFLLTGADYDIATGDLNNDGKPDIVAEATGFRSYVFSNTYTSGAISAASLTASDTTNTSAQEPRIIDIDGDGKLDLATTSGIYRNTTTASNIEFDNMVNVSSGAHYNAHNDFDMDGKMDMVSVNAFSTDLYVYGNTSRTETFSFTFPFATYKTSQILTRAGTGGASASADFDGDGLYDVLTSNGSTDNLSVFRNMGGFLTTASMFASPLTISTGDNPARVYVGDLDVDGKMDLVVSYWTGTSSTIISVYHNTSTVGAISFTKVDYTIGFVSYMLTLSDLDGDGKPEILGTSESTNQFYILKNNSTPGVMNATSFGSPFLTSVTTPRGIATADINLDGRPDIILTTAPNGLLVYENLVPLAPVITFTVEPFSRSVCEGSQLQWSVNATGATNLTYQWQKENAGNFVNLSNDGTYAGVTTSTLTINATTSLDGAVYRCVVNGDNATATNSVEANLTVHPLTPTSQTWGFAFGYGGTGNDQVWDVATDNQGNHVVAGQFENTITIGTNTLVSAGASDIFLAKFDRKGNVLWAKREGGTGFDRIIRIDLDAQGNIVAAGSFEGTTNLGGTNYTSAGLRDVFVAKFDSNGNLNWAAPEGGSGTDDLLGVAADKDGNVFITGQFTGSFTYGSTPINSQTAESDIFTAKYSSTGSFQWIQTVMGSSFEGGWNIDTDDTGNCYVTGTVRGTVDFGLGSVGTSAGFNAFIASYSSTGTIRWANTYGGSGDDVARSIATKTDGTSYVVGSFSGTVKFNTITLTASSTTDAYVATFDSNGIIQWVTNFPSTAAEDAWSVDTDSNGNIYVAGYFNGDLSTCNTTISTIGGNDLYVVKLKPTGSVVWMKKAGDTNADIAYGLAVADEDLVYVGGSFNTVSSFDNFNLTGIGNNAFIAKIGPYISVTDPLDTDGCIGVTITYSVSATGDTGIQFQWQVDDGNGFINITNNATYSGATTNTLSVLVNATLDQYRYRCIASSVEAINQISGDEGLFVSTNITPTVSFANEILTSSSGDTYQWFNNNIAIPGAISQTLEISFIESGVYSVEVTIGGCNGRSDDFVYLITETESSHENLFQVYPNPFSEKIYVNWNSNETATLELTDLLGKENQYQSLINGVNEVDSHRLSRGIYLLVIRSASKTYFIRKVKN